MELKSNRTLAVEVFCSCLLKSEHMEIICKLLSQVVPVAMLCVTFLNQHFKA